MKGLAFMIEKLHRGRADGNAPGHYLNSTPVWRYHATIVAPNEDAAWVLAVHRYGSSELRVAGPANDAFHSGEGGTL